jgi:hypothetical protein
MSSEMLAMRGRLAEMERKYNDLDITVSADISAARGLLDPYEEDITNLRIAEAKAIVDRLFATIEEMKMLARRITMIKRDIGAI